MSSVHSMSNAPGGFTRIRPRSEHEREEGSRTNIEVTERIVSLVIGIVMLCGIFQYSLTGVLTAVVGVWLVYRGSTGHCPICSRIATKVVDEDLEESDGEATEETEIEESFVPPRRPTPVSRRETGLPVSRAESWSELDESPRRKNTRYRGNADNRRSQRPGSYPELER